MDVARDFTEDVTGRERDSSLGNRDNALLDEVEPVGGLAELVQGPGRRGGIAGAQLDLAQLHDDHGPGSDVAPLFGGRQTPPWPGPGHRGTPRSVRAQSRSVCLVMAGPGFGQDYRTCMLTERPQGPTTTER